MAELTPQLIKLTLEECRLVYKDDQEDGPHPWVLKELCAAALAVGELLVDLKIAFGNTNAAIEDYNDVKSENAKLENEVGRLRELERDYYNVMLFEDKALRDENAKLVKEVERLGINEMDCVTLRADNERLTAQVAVRDRFLSELRAENERWNDLAQHNREAADHLEAENERLRDLLREYFDPNKSFWEMKVSAALQSQQGEK